MGLAPPSTVPENWHLTMKRTYEPLTIPHELTTIHKWALQSNLKPQSKSARKKKKRQASADQSDFNMSNTNSPMTSPRIDPNAGLASVIGAKYFFWSH